MSTPEGNTNLRSNCCETINEFTSLYGVQVPAGINPGNIAEGTEPTSCLWSNIFGAEGWWEQSGDNVINPYNRNQQAPRNCINFRKKCLSNNHISLAEKGDCCGAVCESVIRELDILKRVPKVTHKTVTVLGPTKMCKNSVSPPIPILDLWALYIEPSDQSVPQSSLFRFQVSKNGLSWTTLSDDFLTTLTNPTEPAANIYEHIFNSDADACGLNSNCLTCEGAQFAPEKNTSIPQTFPDTNAFFATEGVDGLPRLPCPPNFCFIRIVACTAFCLQSFKATYANGGGFCSSVPLCPAGFVYDDKVCRPNPIRSCPGLPSSGVTGYCDSANPDAPVPAGPIDGTPFRKHMYNNKIRRKLFHVKDSYNAQLRQDESQHMRNVRALAGAPFNSRATNNGTGGLKLNPNAQGFLCGSGCPEDVGVRCGEGCGPDGAFLPRGINCAVPARCRRPYATKHQTEDATLNKLVACAVAGCRKAGGSSPEIWVIGGNESGSVKRLYYAYDPAGTWTLNFAPAGGTIGGAFELTANRQTRQWVTQMGYRTFVSRNGKNWTERLNDSSVTSEVSGLAVDNKRNVWLTAGNGGAVTEKLTNIDIGWTDLPPFTNPPISISGIAIYEDGNQWVAVSPTVNTTVIPKTIQIVYSTVDNIVNSPTVGNVWHTALSTALIQSDHPLNAVAVDQSSGLWITIGDSGTIFTTNNPATWNSLVISGLTENLGDLAVDSKTGRWVIVGDNGTVLTSINPTSNTDWNDLSSQFNNETLNNVAVSSSTGQWVIVGDEVVYWSYDGISWTKNTQSFTNLNMRVVDVA